MEIQSSDLEFEAAARTSATMTLTAAIQFPAKSEITTTPTTIAIPEVQPNTDAVASKRIMTELRKMTLSSTNDEVLQRGPIVIDGVEMDRFTQPLADGIVSSAESQPVSPELVRPYKKLRRFLQTQQDNNSDNGMPLPSDFCNQQESVLVGAAALHNGGANNNEIDNDTIITNGNKNSGGSITATNFNSVNRKTNRPLIPAYLPKKLRGRGRSLDLGRSGSVSTSPSESPVESPLTDWSRDDVTQEVPGPGTRPYCIYD